MSEDKKAASRFALRFLGGIGLMMGSVTVIWLGVSWLFGTLSMVGVLALWVTLVVALASALLWGRIAGRKRPDVFGQFNDAFQRISRGDFSVQVPIETTDSGGPEDHFQKLAHNLNSMTVALARMEELRRNFVSDVSHEFQSPLTSILGFAQALKSADLPADLRLRYLAIIETEARRLSRLSDVLLKLNSLEDRDSPPEPAPFRLDVQLRRVLVALEPQWSAKNLQIEASLNETTVVGNEELLTQVWTNLVHNAIKFTPVGGRVEVRIAAGDNVVVEVEDSGLGLAESELERIFERFYKVESARSHAEPDSGSGLGLALVHRIIALHGGAVKALSRGLGQGTLFRVSLPSATP